jgi:hypothetical protein
VIQDGRCEPKFHFFHRQTPANSTKKFYCASFDIYSGECFLKKKNNFSQNNYIFLFYRQFLVSRPSRHNFGPSAISQVEVTLFHEKTGNFITSKLHVWNQNKSPCSLRQGLPLFCSLIINLSRSNVQKTTIIPVSRNQHNC